MDLREHLAAARLYLVCNARPQAGPLVLTAALSSGVDVVQLRDHEATDAELISAGREFRRVSREFGAMFILNDRVDLVGTVEADGVHLGQSDMSPAEARELIGSDLIVGRSTHNPDQALEAQTNPAVDYLSIGPIHETPTKPGRSAVGLDYVRFAADEITKPWFAIGGIDRSNLQDIIDAGARRIAVVRVITEAEDVATATRSLREVLSR